MKNEIIKAIIYLLVGVSVLLVGMNMMSSGLKRVAGPGLKKFFRKTRENPIAGMGIGLSVTAIIQSSDATIAMVVGFVNAGVMTIYQGLSIMLGGYIGTTVTGVLASFSSLSVSIYLLLFAFIGIVMGFLKSEKVKLIGNVLCGLGLLFFGLAVMKDAFQSESIKDACINLFSSINFGPLLFVIGIIITAIMQSSSAVTSIVIAIVGAGTLELGSAFYIVLGATVGTVTNTLLSCMGGKTIGKRTALIAFTMRLISSLIMLVILMFFDKQIASLLHNFAIDGKDELPVAMFTVFYNLVFMPLLIPFINPFIKVFERLVKDTEQEGLKSAVKHIDVKLIGTPDIAMMQLKKELINMYQLAYSNYKLGFNKIVTQDCSNDKEIELTEDKVDYLNKAITDFLIQLSNKVDTKSEKVIGSYFHVVNDIERIGDHAINFHEMTNSMKERELHFSKTALNEISEINDIVYKMFDMCIDIFENDRFELLPELHALEEKTDELKDIFYTNHYKRVTTNECTDDKTSFISSLIIDLERVADHLTNIAYSISNPTGDDDKD